MKRFKFIPEDDYHSLLQKHLWKQSGRRDIHHTQVSVEYMELKYNGFIE